MNPLIPAIITTIVDTVAPGLSDGNYPAAQQPAAVMGVLRSIPEDAPKAEMDPPLGGQVVMDHTTLSLAVGAQIRDQSNRIVMPATVTERQMVRFKLDPGGQVSQVWILTPEERQQPAPTFR
ncbi:MAG: hypothetical protein E6R14_07465 [Thermomicrobiales bacterium]|jgi:hypothetical protein|nr:MAG: hypothetical protein E6R14_07465 [Thermomicrobiales bacterium]